MSALLRFIVYAVPVLVLLLALFGFAVELLDAEPRSGSVIRLALFDQPRVPGQLVLGTWLVEASGLIALFLLTQGRFGAWWLDGLVAGWVGWIFRGPLLVVTIVVATRQPQDPWWTLAFGWWALYSVCGLSLAMLARRSGLEPWSRPREQAKAVSPADVSSAETAEIVASESEDLANEGDQSAEEGEILVEDEGASDGPEDPSVESAEPETESEEAVGDSELENASAEAEATPELEAAHESDLAEPVAAVAVARREAETE